MFAMDQNKTQEERVLTPEDAGAGVIVSPDTRRRESRTSGAEPHAEMAHPGYQRRAADRAGAVEVFDRRPGGASNGVELAGVSGDWSA